MGAENVELIASSDKVLIDIDIEEPSESTMVFKDECMHCFFTPLNPDGLFICVASFYGFCIKHIHEYQRHTGRTFFLVINQTEETIEKSEEPETKIGYARIEPPVEKFTITEYAFVIYPDLHVKIPVENLCPKLQSICNRITESSGAKRADLLQYGISAWDDGEKKICKHSTNLVQIDNPPVIPSSGWICEVEGCGLTENLWLNLTDGAIRCGRSQYIQEGVKTSGNNHMRIHFDKTKFPLVVKLGTISKDGADVYSYDEDDSVIDLNLAQHLKHFGIDMLSTEKTEKTTSELELDMNEKWEWSMCLEDGANLELAFGPGLTGMINIGSSCYINASIQMLIQIPEFMQQFGENSMKHFYPNGKFLDGHRDLNCQTAKVISSLMSGDFSLKDGKFNGIKPEQFRRVVGQGHFEFSTAKQQDVDEYLRYFLTKIDQSVCASPNPVNPIRFKMETRLFDCDSKMVQYSQIEELILSLAVPIREAAEIIQSDNDDKTKVLRPTISFQECLESTFAEQAIPDFRSPITNGISGAKLTRRIASFPDYLIIQLQKFYIAKDWTVKKMDVNVDMPHIFDLEYLRAHGPQEGESLFSNGDQESQNQKAKKAEPSINNEYVEMICSMGFTPEASRRAVYMTENRGVQEASDWLMSHLDDMDINEEHPDLKRMMAGSSSYISNITELEAMGFLPHQAEYALKETKGDVNQAAIWLLSHADEVPLPIESSKDAAVEQEFTDGSAQYELIGFISHMGSSPNSGHYVCHLKKNGIWYLFNDEKVAVSQNPPTTLAYIYLYRRCPELSSLS